MESKIETKFRRKIQDYYRCLCVQVQLKECFRLKLTAIFWVHVAMNNYVETLKKKGMTQYKRNRAYLNQKEAKFPPTNSHNSPLYALFSVLLSHSFFLF